MLLTSSNITNHHQLVLQDFKLMQDRKQMWEKETK